jgi:hypothetical protein
MCWTASADDDSLQERIERRANSDRKFMARYYGYFDVAAEEWSSTVLIISSFRDVDTILDQNWLRPPIVKSSSADVILLEYRARISLLLTLISEVVNDPRAKPSVESAFPGVPKLIKECRNAAAHPNSPLHRLPNGSIATWNSDGESFQWGKLKLEMRGALLPAYETARQAFASQGYGVGQESPAKKYLRHFDRDGKMLGQDLMLEGSLKTVLEHPPRPVFPDCAEIVTYDGREYAADELTALRNQQGL